MLYKSIFDNFMHIRPEGYFLEAIDAFKKYGGTSINLVNFPEGNIGNNYYEYVYGKTIKTAEKIKEKGIGVIITIGPYPLDYFSFMNNNPIEKLKSGIDLAVKYIVEGKADVLGEIGYPHFDISPEIYESSEKILIYAMESCKDYDIPLILHTEDLNREKYEHIEDMAYRHYNKERILKHHANYVDFNFNNTILKSLIASRPNVKYSIESNQNFLLETDYTDQKEKPGKVMPPYSVPKRAEMIMNQYDDYDRILNKIFIETPYKFYKKDFFLV